MMKPQSDSPALPPPLKFVGGDPSLDLVNTVDWTAAGLANERLGEYSRLIEWANGAGILGRARQAELLKIARARPRMARLAHERVRRARFVLRRLFASIADCKAAPGALRDFNRLLLEAGQHLRLSYGGSEAREFTWRPDRPDDLDTVLWAVMHRAARLLECEAAQLRICAGVDCGWMFVDRSRNGLRRWCEMRTCGTAAKSRRRAARRVPTATRTP